MPLFRAAAFALPDTSCCYGADTPRVQAYASMPEHARMISAQAMRRRAAFMLDYDIPPDATLARCVIDGGAPAIKMSRMMSAR